MSAITLSRAEYAAAIGEPEELLEPIPQCALASGAVRATPFHLMLPDGCGGYVANFGPFEQPLFADGAFIRYGSHKPVLKPISPCRALDPGDNLYITYYPSSGANLAPSESGIGQ